MDANPAPNQTTVNEIDEALMPTGPRIPTLGKDKHPIGFCYPVGASIMSEALADTVQFPRMMLYFSAQTPIYDPRLAQRAFPLLRVVYRNYPAYQPKNPTAGNVMVGGEQWIIHVYAILKDRLFLIRDKFVNAVLPEFKTWLASPEIPTPPTRRYWRECWILTQTGECRWRDIITAGETTEANEEMERRL